MHTINSSSGIIEAPSLGIYTINIGDRQNGRVRGNSVIDIKCESTDIGEAIENVLSYNTNIEKIVNPYYQKDIEKELDISNPTVTGILNRLEVKGLITRVPCRHDARAKNIEVTEKALELDKQLRIVFQQSDEKLVESLSKEEIDNLQSYLIKILRSNS